MTTTINHTLAVLASLALSITLIASATVVPANEAMALVAIA